MSKKLKVVLFLSSTRVGASHLGTGSWGDRVGSQMEKCLEEAGFDVTVWDPKKNEYTLLQQPMHLAADASGFPKWMKDRKLELDSADAFLICSAEYNAAMPPALTNMLDHYPPASYRHRPVGLLTYSVSNFGGVRIQPTLKAFVTELGMVPIPTIGNVAKVGEKFEADGTLKDDNVLKYFRRQASELKWYAEALKQYKEKNPVAAENPEIGGS